MPTRPTTHRGIKSQNNKLSKWVEKCYPDFTSYEVILLDSWIMSTDFPIYKKQLPQVWLEDGNFIIESSSFRYVIADDLKLLFKLCRRFKSDAIAQTYATK